MTSSISDECDSKYWMGEGYQETIPDLSSLLECISWCTARQFFICRSVVYESHYYKGKTYYYCYLYAENKLTSSNLYEGKINSQYCTVGMYVSSNV